MFPSSSFHPVSVQFLLTYFIFLVLSELGETRNMAENSPVYSSNPAFFSFGDSTVDTGNNNYIKTILKSNFPPYGKDFPNHIPTGRFCNGKIFTDFLASYMGIKDSIPPYLDPTLGLEDLKTGVCFASATTGFDPLTAIMSGVIPISKQLENFKEYESRMETYIGKEETKILINNAIYFISCGSNDIAINYYGIGIIRRTTYNITGYLDYLLKQGEKLIQSLVEMGARKIAFAGVLPLGCPPAAITVFSGALIGRRCVEWLSSVARDYNRLLQNKLMEIQSQLSPDISIMYADLYTPLDDMIKMPQQFGIEEVTRSCCGTGLVEVSILCNPVSLVCSDASKYVFWDSVHPTQVANYHIFQSLRPMADRFLN